MIKVALDPHMYHGELSVAEELRIDNGEVDWAEFFGALRDLEFDGIATVCVFGWEESADDIHRRMPERVTGEFS
jgi:myo-inositol catabolism protein IolH